MTARGDGGAEVAARIAGRLRDVPDFPQPGIVFKDIAPLLADPDVFGVAISALAGFARAAGGADLVAGIEARGYGQALAGQESGDRGGEVASDDPPYAPRLLRQAGPALNLALTGMKRTRHSLEMPGGARV